MHYNAFSFDGRQRWLVYHGSRQCRPTNLIFNFYLLVVFLPFFSGKMWHFGMKFPTISVGRRAIQSRVQRDRFFVRDYC